MVLKLNLKVTKQKQHTQIPIPRNSIFPKGCVRVEEKVEINNNNDYENDPFQEQLPRWVFSVHTGLSVPLCHRSYHTVGSVTNRDGQYFYQYELNSLVKVSSWLKCGASFMSWQGNVRHILLGKVQANILLGKVVCPLLI